jgi:hypothetical protein
MKRTTFAALEIGSYFNANGNRCKKVPPEPPCCLLRQGFYFNQEEHVRV